MHEKAVASNRSGASLFPQEEQVPALAESAFSQIVRSGDGTGYEDGFCSPGGGVVCPALRDRAGRRDRDAGCQPVQDVEGREKRMYWSGPQEEAAQWAGPRGPAALSPADSIGVASHLEPSVRERGVCLFVGAPLDRGVESC